MFTLAELVRIGEPGAALPEAFGTPTLALDTRLRLAWRPSEPWEPFSGRSSLGLLASLTPDLPLRIAEFTVQAGLPPEVYPGVLAFAVQDLIDSADLTSSEDWLGLVHHAGALTRERFDDYVTALAGLGILSPATAGRCAAQDTRARTAVRATGGEEPPVPCRPGDVSGRRCAAASPDPTPSPRRRRRCRR